MKKCRSHGGYILLVGIFLISILRCGPIGEPIDDPHWNSLLNQTSDDGKGHRHFTVDAPNAMSPTGFSSFEHSKSRKVGFVDPIVSVFKGELTVQFQMKVTGLGPSKFVKLKGEFEQVQPNRLWTAILKLEEKPDDLRAIVKAKALCFVKMSDQKLCTQVGVDFYVLYHKESKVFKYQYKAGSPSFSEDSKSDGEAPIEEPEAHKKDLLDRLLESTLDVSGDDELAGKGQFLEYVSPKVDKKFFDDFPVKTEVVEVESQSQLTSDYLEQRIKELDELILKKQKNLEKRKKVDKKRHSEPNTEKKGPPAKPQPGTGEDVDGSKDPTDSTEGSEKISEDPSQNQNPNSVDEKSSLDDYKQEAALLRELEIKRTRTKRLQTILIRDEKAEETFRQENGIIYEPTFLDLHSGGHAVSYVNSGWINGDSLMDPAYTKDYKAHYASHGQHFGSGLLISLLKSMGKEFQKIYKGAGPLHIAAISQQGGGKLWFTDKSDFHRSHQNGLDVDAHYLIEKHLDPEKFHPFDVELNFEFFKFLVSLQMKLKNGSDSSVVRTIFVNKGYKKQICQWAKSQGTLERDWAVHRRIRGVTKHLKHFHLRLRCSRSYEGCEEPKETVNYRCGP